MISAVIDKYLDDLAEYIFVDDKLVTYRWLSKELGLHVNLAKQILWQFLNEHDKGKEAVATFILMGYLADGKLRVEIVKEPDLPFAKRKFVKLSAEHVYSLQRALPDLELLALGDSGDHKNGAIVCKEIQPRSGEELHVLRWGSKINNVATPAVEKSTTTTTIPTTKFPQSKPISGADSRVESKVKKVAFPEIFGRDANGQKVVKNPPACVTRNKTAPVTLFSDDKGAVNARGRKRHGSKEREKGKKKLRLDGAGFRSSEESSDNEEQESDNDEMLCSPEGAGPPKNIAGSKSLDFPAKYKIENGNKKVQKIVEKTSLDKNGYIITEKEYAYESSANKGEGSIVAKTEAPKPPRAAPYKPKRTQASLLNFFKKP